MLEVTLTPPDEDDDPASLMQGDTYDWEMTASRDDLPFLKPDDNSTNPTYPRVLSPISGLTEDLSQMRTSARDERHEEDTRRLLFFPSSEPSSDAQQPPCRQALHNDNTCNGTAVGQRYHHQTTSPMKTFFMPNEEEDKENRPNPLGIATSPSSLVSPTPVSPSSIRVKALETLTARFDAGDDDDEQLEEDASSSATEEDTEDDEEEEERIRLRLRPVVPAETGSLMIDSGPLFHSDPGLDVKSLMLADSPAAKRQHERLYTSLPELPIIFPFEGFSSPSPEAPTPSPSTTTATQTAPTTFDPPSGQPLCAPPAAIPAVVIGDSDEDAIAAAAAAAATRAQLETTSRALPTRIGRQLRGRSSTAGSPSSNPFLRRGVFLGAPKAPPLAAVAAPMSLSAPVASKAPPSASSPKAKAAAFGGSSSGGGGGSAIHQPRSRSLREERARSRSRSLRITKSRPSSPASRSPVASPAVVPRSSLATAAVPSFLHQLPPVAQQQQQQQQPDEEVRTAQRVRSLIPSITGLNANNNNNGGGGGEGAASASSLAVPSSLRSPRLSPRAALRSKLRHSSEVLLEASPKRSSGSTGGGDAGGPGGGGIAGAWLGQRRGSLPAVPGFPAFPSMAAAGVVEPTTAAAGRRPPQPPGGIGIGMRIGHNGNNNNFGGGSVIANQLASLQGEFNKDFSLTKMGARQSDGEALAAEPVGTPTSEQSEEEEEEDAERMRDAATIRRSVSAMDIAETMKDNRKKRKLSRRKCDGQMSFQNHCERVREEQSCRVPTIMCPKHPDLDVITPQTLMRLLKGELRDCFSQVFVVDCRYPYEYDGGHVLGAVNLHDLDLIESTFPIERCDEENEKQKKPAIVFHCEFSSERGPKGYRHLRKLDRELNYDMYPKLYYPHLFLLAGGYKGFFQEGGGELCEPRNYVAMRDVRFAEEMKKHAADMKRRAFKKFRSQSTSCLTTFLG